ncbi:MAG: energy-coupling factor transporter transmembrane component T family protein [Bryobacteraceae bacterium]
MHHLVLDEWSRRDGWLQKRDPRAKLAVLLACLVALASSRSLTWPVALGFIGMLAAGTRLGRLPVAGVAWRACVVLPFAGAVALAAAVAGQGREAASLLARSYFSAAFAVIVAGTTPLGALLRGLQSLGAPRLFVLVVNFLYRYLFVLSEEAQHMRLAARSRGACRAAWRRNRSLWRAAAGALAMLFARSQARAGAIHRAMVARGFQGDVVFLGALRMRRGDWLLLAAGCTALMAIATGAAFIQ